MKINFTLKVTIGLILGACFGLFLNEYGTQTPWVQFTLNNVFNPVYKVFLQGLFMVVVPLVFSYIVLGIANLKRGKALSKIGRNLVLYYATTSVIALVIGHFLVLTIEPGKAIDPQIVAEAQQALASQVEGLKSKSLAAGTHFWPGIVSEIVPKNILSAFSQNNLLATIFIAILSGLCLLWVKEEDKDFFLKGCSSVGALASQMINVFMALAPYAIFCLIANAFSILGFGLLKGVLLYVLTVTIGLLLQFIGVYSFILKFIVKMNPITFYKNMSPVFMTAFGTASSMATMPTTIKTLDEKLGVSRKISSLSIPIGTTVNMDGTCLFEIIAALFIAQVFGVDLSLSDHIILVILVFLTAAGAAGIPGGSIPILMSAMAVVGIPPEGIAIVLGVDRLLDMLRTVVNVTGDSVGAILLSKSKGLAEYLKTD